MYRTGCTDVCATQKRLVLICVASLDPARSNDHWRVCQGHYIGDVNKHVEMVARLCGHAVVVDENMMAHAQLGNGNLLIYAGTPVVY